ncbi:hypothetical protein BU14_0515s0001, partial [Porphyra umbilicalis]
TQSQLKWSRRRDRGHGVRRGRGRNLRGFAADAARQLDVFGHDRHALGVNGAKSDLLATALTPTNFPGTVFPVTVFPPVLPAGAAAAPLPADPHGCEMPSRSRTVRLWRMVVSTNGVGQSTTRHAVAAADVAEWHAHGTWVGTDGCRDSGTGSGSEKGGKPTRQRPRRSDGERTGTEGGAECVSTPRRADVRRRLPPEPSRRNGPTTGCRPRRRRLWLRASQPFRADQPPLAGACLGLTPTRQQIFAALFRGLLSVAAESIALLALSLTESASCQSLAWRSDVRVQPILIFDVYDTVNSRFKIAGHKIVSENKSTHMKVVRCGIWHHPNDNIRGRLHVLPCAAICISHVSHRLSRSSLAPPRPVLVRLNPAPTPGQGTPPRQRLRRAAVPAAPPVTPGDRLLRHRSPATAGDRKPPPPSPPHPPSLPSAPLAAAIQLAAATATAGHLPPPLRSCREVPSHPTGLMLPRAAAISPPTAAVAPPANLGRDAATPATDLCARCVVVPPPAVAAVASRCVPARPGRHRRRALPPRVVAPPPPPPRRRACPAGTTSAADSRKASWRRPLWRAGGAGEGKAPRRRWSGGSRRLRGPRRPRRAGGRAAAAAADRLSPVRRSHLTWTSSSSSRPPLRAPAATPPPPPLTAAVLPAAAVPPRHRPVHLCRGRRWRASPCLPPWPPPRVVAPPPPPSRRRACPAGTTSAADSQKAGWRRPLWRAVGRVAAAVAAAAAAPHNPAVAAAAGAAGVNGGAVFRCHDGHFVDHGASTLPPCRPLHVWRRLGRTATAVIATGSPTAVTLPDPPRPPDLRAPRTRTCREMIGCRTSSDPDVNTGAQAADRQQTQYEVARLCQKLTPTLPKDSRLRSAELRCRETLTEAHETRRYPPPVTLWGLRTTAGPDTFPFRLRGNVRAVEALSAQPSRREPQKNSRRAPLRSPTVVFDTSRQHLTMPGKADH